ncbi:hypothetical protein [Tsukamurella paurometabola]|uniref:Uncharacterized protein n=1 Tax=Tsukamurella paurometabola TaxID=2061 RepID=A0A3P8LFX5_TSUPA|nr:hypothetical protein [Tsukamurella paurometabola]UEA82950.1 hypothetical protein LK411_21750 [Tsukamurella paurometabola]VDR40032.1 Uncharacterised protein [Tsukamurella paurometabola]
MTFPTFDTARTDEDNQDRYVHAERGIDFHIDALDQWVTAPARIVFNGRGCEFELGPYSLCEGDAIELYKMLGLFLGHADLEAL